MIILLALLAAVFVHMTYKDIKVRLVFRRDLVALVVLRIVALVVVLVGEYCFGVSSVLGLTNEQWGVRSLILSIAMAFIICAFVQGVAFITNRLTNKYGAKEESIGLGDVKLYAACSLFLSVEAGLVFLFLSALEELSWHCIAKSSRSKERFRLCQLLRGRVLPCLWLNR